MQPKLKIQAHFQSDKFAARVRRGVSAAVKAALPRMKEVATDLVLTEARRGRGASLYEKDLAKRDAVTFTDTELVITLKDPLLRSIEAGIDGYDMKARLLSSKNSKVSKTGTPYVDIPFTHDPSTIPPPIKKALTKTARVSTKTPGAVTRKTIRGKSRMTVRHKRGIADDMMRRGNVYTTVRRLSAKSAPSSWWHPGFTGRHVLKKTSPAIQKAITVVLRNALTDSGFGVKP